MSRTVSPEDVQVLLCGTARAGSTDNDVPGQNIIFTEARRRELFVGMISAILTDKEAEERARQQSGRGMPLAEVEAEEGGMALPEDAERIRELTDCGGWTDPAPPKTRKADGQTLDPPVAGCNVIYY